MELVLILIVVLAVFYKLGLFRPIVSLCEVATRESDVYNFEHKGAVGLRYQNGVVDVDVDKVNENIKKISELHFD